MMSLESLTDSEVRAKLAEYGYSVGPVTKTTRSVILRKLSSLMESQANKPTVAISQSDEDPQLLFFDIETSGLGMDCEVLQIAAKAGSHVFNEYIKPTMPIPRDTTAINNLSKRGDELYFKEEILRTRPVRLVLEDFLRYLKNFEKPCVLVAHNCSFDASRLIRVIRKESMVDSFAAVIVGFTDTLRMFRNKYPNRRGRGSCTLTTLVTETLSVPIVGAHDASNDARMLEQLALHHFTVQELLTNSLGFHAAWTQ